MKKEIIIKLSKVFEETNPGPNQHLTSEHSALSQGILLATDQFFLMYL